MSERHPDDATFVAWVSGALGDAESAAFEAHVVELACSPCALRLQQHARLEEFMHEAAADMRGSTRRAQKPDQKPNQKPKSMPAGLALAASLVLGLGLPGRWLSFDGAGEPIASRTATVDATPWREPAPACPVTNDDPSSDLCDDPAASFELEGALAMTMPEPAGDDGPNFCEDDLEGDGLVCGVGESFDG